MDNVLPTLPGCEGKVMVMENDGYNTYEVPNMGKAKLS